MNAATGPIEVEGAEPGDILAVEIEAVRVTEGQGRVVTTPDFGLLQDDEEIEHPENGITEVDGDTIEFDGREIRSSR